MLMAWLMDKGRYIAWRQAEVQGAVGGSAVKVEASQATTFTYSCSLAFRTHESSQPWGQCRTFSFQRSFDHPL